MFLTTRQTTKIGNAFANNMTTDIKLSEAQLSKIISSGGFLDFWLDKLSKKVVATLAITFTKNSLPILVRNMVSNAASNGMNKFERIINGNGVVGSGKGLTF